MKMLTPTTILTLALSLGLIAGCASEPTVRPGPEAPPPPETEIIPPQPNMTFVWTPGFWDWRGGRWVWTGGYWGPRPHPGAVWVNGRWVRRGGRNTWVRPHWQ